jgi:putative redox protein
MAITLARQQPGVGQPMAQRLHIRAHELLADVAADAGGADSGPDPHDLYDAALGACKALTVLWYANRRGIPVADVQTVVERDGSQERSGTYKLHTRLQISGDLSDAQMKELESAAGKCPIHKLMAQATTDITTTVERA